MSDFENELLGLAEDDPNRRRKKRSHPSGGKKPKSKAHVEESEGEEEMDMDLESEEGEGEDEDFEDDPPKRNQPVASTSKSKPLKNGVSGNGRNPYPLEGKYIDEEDRDELEAMPEIDRENILAGRLEEMQKFKDSAQLDAMYKMAGMAGEEEDSGEEPSRKKRKHTSVTKEATKAINDLKSRRKAKDERAQRRAARRETKARSASPGSESASTEDGEIPARDLYKRDRERERERERSPVTKIEKKEKKDLDALPANRQEVNAARLSRYELVDLMFKDQFEEVITGAYVRLMAGEPDENGRPKYRIHKITGVKDDHNHGGYSIEYQGRNVMDSRALVCQYGKASRHFRIADVSNGDFEETEFIRFSMTNQSDRIPPPKRSDLSRKHDEIKQLRERPMTNEEISRQVESRQKSNPQVQRQKKLLEITSLMSSRELAIRRNDTKGLQDIEQQIISLGGDPTTGNLVDSKTVGGSSAPGIGGHLDGISEYDQRIQKINDNNRRKTKEAMAVAHAASLARKRAEEAIVKAKTQAQLNGETPLTDIPVIVPPPSGLKKGETPQEYVARTIELDLGDF